MQPEPTLPETVGAPRAATPSWLVPTALVALAFLVRLFTVIVTRHMVLTADPADYHRLAVSLIHGHGFGPSVLTSAGGPTSFRAPLYPMFLAAMYSIIGPSIFAVRLLEALPGAAAAGMIGVVAGQLWGRRAALIALALAAVYPPLVFVGSGILTEAISLPIQMGAFAAALAYRASGYRHWGYVVLAGVLAGLLVLDRAPQAILLVPLALLCRPTGVGWRRQVGPPLMAIAIAAVAVVPWVVRDAIAFHRFVPISTQSGFIAAGVYNDEARTDATYPALWRTPLAVQRDAPLFRDNGLNEAQLSDELAHRGEQYALAHPSYVGRSVFWNTVRLFDLKGPEFARLANAPNDYSDTVSDLWFAGYVVVGCLALLGAATRRVRAVPIAMWLAPVLIVAVTVPTLGITRYRAPVEPSLVLLAVAAIDTFIDRLRVVTTSAWPPSA